MVYLSSFALSTEEMKNPNIYPYCVFENKGYVQKGLRRMPMDRDIFRNLLMSVDLTQVQMILGIV